MYFYQEPKNWGLVERLNALEKKYGKNKWYHLKTKLKPTVEEMDDLHLEALIQSKIYYNYYLNNPMFHIVGHNDA